MNVAAAPSTCRNCGASSSGHYCANCGQETRVELPTFRSFMREAAGRYVALDGRLWRTLYGLIARPGFLTLEYFAGRRRRYIRPARLFLVSSLLLFAVIGMLKSPDFIADEVTFVDSRDGNKAKRLGAAKGAPAAPSSAKATPAETKAPEGGVRPQSKGIADTDTDSVFGVDEDLNLTLKLDGQDVLPESLKARRERFKTLSPEQKLEQIYGGMLRFGPYAMVVLLPAFAFLLKLAYLGRSKPYPGRPRRYAEHLVYSAHLHAFAALVLVLMVVIPVTPIRVLLGFWIVFYIMRARQNVYRGRWWAGLLRAFVIALLYTVLISIAVGTLLIAAILLR